MEPRRGGSRSGTMSETTPEHAPKAGSQTADDVPEAVPEAATIPSETAAVPIDTDPDVAAPPSSPVSARGHINQPATDDDAPAAVPAASEPVPAPVKVTEPEPVVTTEDDVAAAVAR